MATPFDFAPAPTAVIDAPTDKQVEFLTALLRGEGLARGVEAGYVEAHLPAMVAERATSKRAASVAIDEAKGRGARPVWSAAEATPEIADTQLGLTDAELEGFWAMDGDVFKVQIAVHGSGRPYAKVMVDGVWDYARGAVARIRRGEATPLTLEAAAEHGHLYGSCICCGRTLTDEGSIAAGIGPVCAKKYF
ncbi:hypothetical protein SEA_CAIB_42 [Gordonia phage CaiB]|nr:hypothetical protein SEA_CAIB_42 [Gordonia phage CaiB]